LRQGYCATSRGWMGGSAYLTSLQQVLLHLYYKRRQDANRRWLPLLLLSCISDALAMRERDVLVSPEKQPHLSSATSDEPRLFKKLLLVRGPSP
jgi:hypothetical protein